MKETLKKLKFESVRARKLEERLIFVRKEEVKIMLAEFKLIKFEDPIEIFEKLMFKNSIRQLLPNINSVIKPETLTFSRLILAFGLRTREFEIEIELLLLEDAGNTFKLKIIINTFGIISKLSVGVRNKDIPSATPVKLMFCVIWMPETTENPKGLGIRYIVPPVWLINISIAAVILEYGVWGLRPFMEPVKLD